MKTIKERDVEDYLKKRVAACGGTTRKLQWIGRRAAPDRVVLLYGAHFVEVKAPGEEPRGEQVREHNRMRGHGVDVWIVDSLDAVENFIEKVMPLDLSGNEKPERQGVLEALDTIDGVLVSVFERERERDTIRKYVEGGHDC